MCYKVCHFDSLFLTPRNPSYFIYTQNYLETSDQGDSVTEDETGDHTESIIRRTPNQEAAHQLLEDRRENPPWLEKLRDKQNLKKKHRLVYAGCKQR